MWSWQHVHGCSWFSVFPSFPFSNFIEVEASFETLGIVSPIGDTEADSDSDGDSFDATFLKVSQGYIFQHVGITMTSICKVRKVRNSKQET